MSNRNPNFQQQALALNTYIKLTRAADSLSGRLATGGTQGDLSPTQFAVLEMLYHLGPLCQSEIGGKLLKSRGNMTLVIDNLEKRGLVARQREEHDRRLVLVSLTRSGRQLIAVLFPQHAEAIALEMQVLTPVEQQTLGDLCRKLGKGRKHP